MTSYKFNLKSPLNDMQKWGNLKIYLCHSAEARWSIARPSASHAVGQRFESRQGTIINSK